MNSKLISHPTGRNEPCPCGSGRKFKKCCLSLVEAIPPKQVLGGYYYAAPDYLQRAAPYDPLLILENLTALAVEAEEEGNIAQAMEILRKLEPLAERTGMLGNLLRYWEMMCYNHPELGENGLDIMRRLQSFYQGKDREQWAYASLDLADYLGLQGRREEGRKEYEKLLSEMPSSPFIHIRFAHFLEKGDHIEEAAHHYKQVIQNAQSEKEELEMAAQELKELASQGLELDTQTQEAIRKLNLDGEKKKISEKLLLKLIK